MDNEQNQPVNTKAPNTLEVLSFRYPTMSNVISFIVGVVVGVALVMVML